LSFSNAARALLALASLYGSIRKLLQSLLPFFLSSSSIAEPPSSPASKVLV